MSHKEIFLICLTSETDCVGEVLVLLPIPRSSHSPVMCAYLYSSDLEVEFLKFNRYICGIEVIVVSSLSCQKHCQRLIGELKVQASLS